MDGHGVGWGARLRHGRWRQIARRLSIVVLSAIAIVGTWRAVSLTIAARSPIDAWLVLGGSIKREMYVADKLADPDAPNFGDPVPVRVGDDVPVLISAGSPLPCLWAVFSRTGANLDRVWIEACARSTFENFVYSLPILIDWNARHIKLTTSATHYPRAKWMARAAFGLRGLWVEFDTAPEVGVPGNRESPQKAILDVTRTVAWSIVAPVLPVRCDRVVNLARVDWSAWRAREFVCEHQGGVEPEDLPPPLGAPRD